MSVINPMDEVLNFCYKFGQYKKNPVWVTISKQDSEL